MKRRCFFLLLGLVSLLGCGPTATALPAAVSPTPAASTTASPPPDLLARPAMTVQGQLASGVPYGVTADGGDFQGDPQAPVMILEFSDLQCPYCARYVRETFPQIQKNFIATGKVVYVFRHFPLSGHPQAQIAAEAVECAGLQGQFWPMHEHVFLNQAEWSGQNNALSVLLGYGAKLGLERAAYQTCLGEHQTAQKVRQDYAFGQSIQVPSTPAFLIIGRSAQGLVGAQPYANFERAIESALASLQP